MSGFASGGVTPFFRESVVRWVSAGKGTTITKQTDEPPPPRPPPRVECFGRRRLGNGRTRPGFRMRYSVAQDGDGLSQANNASFVCSARSKTQNMRRLFIDMMRWIRLHPCLFDRQQVVLCRVFFMLCTNRHVYFIKRRSGQSIRAFAGCHGKPGKSYSTIYNRGYSSHDCVLAAASFTNLPS